MHPFAACQPGPAELREPALEDPLRPPLNKHKMRGSKKHPISAFKQLSLGKEQDPWQRYPEIARIEPAPFLQTDRSGDRGLRVQEKTPGSPPSSPAQRSALGLKLQKLPPSAQRRRATTGGLDAARKSWP